ncbi:MAG: hypothetical protein ACRD4B_08360, partial [Acidobacteriota bacterium]
QFVADVTKGTHPLNSSRFPGTVSFLVDGKEVNSKKVSNSGTYTYVYTASGGGSHTVQAIIVDSVLYDDSDTATFTSSGGGGGGPTITDYSVGRVYWNGGEGEVTIKHEGGGDICDSNGDNCFAPGLNSGDRIYAEDDDGKTSPIYEI